MSGKERRREEERKKKKEKEGENHSYSKVKRSLFKKNETRSFFSYLFLFFLSVFFPGKKLRREKKRERKKVFVMNSHLNFCSSSLVHFLRLSRLFFSLNFFFLFSLFPPFERESERSEREVSEREVSEREREKSERES